MKPLMIALIASLTLATLVPSAFAAPQWVEDACWRYANRVLPALDAREREARIANCIADWTAGTPPPRGRKSYNRNRY
jgi:phosphoribosylformimino-5-aminoimidazole carboxamide ribonucleotide (ProFAR) isomerase